MGSPKDTEKGKKMRKNAHIEKLIEVLKGWGPQKTEKMGRKGEKNAHIEKLIPCVSVTILRVS